MKIWKLTQSDNSGWDTYDSIIVAAETESEAKNIMPDEHAAFGKHYNSWASSIDGVNAECIGEAIKGTVSGLILASFNAG